MLSVTKYRKRAVTILLAIALLMLFTAAMVSPVMGSDHVEGCVEWDDEGNCLKSQAAEQVDGMAASGFTPSNELDLGD